MQVYKSFQEVPFEKKSVVTLGTFDGVHAGHKVLIDRLLSEARSREARPVIITFDPHPQLVIPRADKPPVRILTTIEERLELFADYGAEHVVVQQFSSDFAATPAEDFIGNYIVGKIGAEKIVVGHDHMFGAGRAGDQELLLRLGEEHSFEVERVGALSMSDGTAISSTKIRRALAEGNLSAANAMLGYPYRYRGTVIEGDGRGRKIGLPTANIESPLNEVKLLPKNGVYLVSSIIDGTIVFGMANVGIRPTFTESSLPNLEVHYLGFGKMLYGNTVEVSFLQYLREERKFQSVDMFLAQISEDRSMCEEIIDDIRKNA
jgi:riboflavin kinase/FMN adenylyltransferase